MKEGPDREAVGARPVTWVGASPVTGVILACHVSLVELRLRAPASQSPASDATLRGPHPVKRG